MPAPTRLYRFPASRRLSGRRAFAAVYAGSAKLSRGPIVLFSIPNSLPHSRWGLSVSRRVGTAVRRNRIKRLLREAVRFLQNEIPGGYDFVIVVRPHEPLILAEYQRILSHLATRSHSRWANNS